MIFQKGQFVIVPNKQQLKGLKPAVQTVFFWLCSHSDQSGVSWPSRSTLAAEAGMSVDTLDRVLKELEETGMVEKSPQYRGNEQTSNVYQVLLIADDGEVRLGQFKGKEDDGWQP